MVVNNKSSIELSWRTFELEFVQPFGNARCAKSQFDWYYFVKQFWWTSTGKRNSKLETIMIVHDLG